MFSFCVELLLYPKFLNNGYFCYGKNFLVIFQNSFQFGVNKIF